MGSTGREAVVTRCSKLSASWAQENFPCANGSVMLGRGASGGAVPSPSPRLPWPDPGLLDGSLLCSGQEDGGGGGSRGPFCSSPRWLQKWLPSSIPCLKQSCRNGRAPCVPELPQITPAFITVAQPQLYLKVLDFHAPSVCSVFVRRWFVSAPSPVGCSPLGKQERCL